MEGLDATEKQRLVDLIHKDKDRAVSTSAMDWMQSDKMIHSDDYLLGKKIDKHFEQGDQPPSREEDDIFGERIKANIALDMQAKMREDPLYAIKKREDESKRKILHNPVKLKELKKLIGQQKKNKKKIKKKCSHRFDEDDLVQQYLSILTRKHGYHKKKRHHSGYDIKVHQTKGRDHSPGCEITETGQMSAILNRREHQHPHQNCSRAGKKHRSRPSREDSNDFTSSSEITVKQRSSRRRELSNSSSSEVDSRERRYGLTDQESSRYQSSFRSKSPKFGEKKINLLKSKHPKSQRCGSPYGDETQNFKFGNLSNHWKEHTGTQSRSALPKRKVDQKERDRRLKEMMDNAKWREEQRKSNVQWHREEDLREENLREEMQRNRKGSCGDFLNPLMSQHATLSTVEDRLKRNKHNIQRTKAALDRDFTEH